MRPRLAVFGDSHYACLRLAHGQGLVDLSALDVEYWGHVGKRFRALDFRDGAIHPTDPVTAAQPITGGKAPAAPPMTMFCGVRRFSHIV